MRVNTLVPDTAKVFRIYISVNVRAAAASAAAAFRAAFSRNRATNARNSRPLAPHPHKPRRIYRVCACVRVCVCSV